MTTRRLMATACGVGGDRGVGRQWRRRCAAAVHGGDYDDGTGRQTTMGDDG